jgi:hypothetical protein
LECRHYIHLQPHERHDVEAEPGDKALGSNTAWNEQCAVEDTPHHPQAALEDVAWVAESTLTAKKGSHREVRDDESAEKQSQRLKSAAGAPTHSFSFMASRTRSSWLLCPTNKLLTNEASTNVTHIDTTMKTMNIPELLCMCANASS